MEYLLPIVIGIGVVAYLGLSAFAEARLPWRHPLNMLLNGDPSVVRRSASDLGSDSDSDGGCGGG